MAKKDHIPVVPTLHAISSPSLTKPEDIAIYLIRMLFVNPGRTSAFNEEEMISYRKLAAEYGTDPDRLASEIARQLTLAMGHYFPTGGYLAQCTVEDIEKVSEEGIYQGNKAITINMTGSNGTAVVPRASIIVNEAGDKFDIKIPTNPLGGRV